MRNDPSVNDISDLAGNRYPHLKLTVERFPRLLATRRVEDDGSEYFGAFLTKTSVRILIDLLNKTFRLRSCELEIDGRFDAPCTQYYRRRCVAPCVESLCSVEEYSGLVGLVRFVLANDQGSFRKLISNLIHDRSEQLDFESAAKYRDILTTIETWWQKERLQVWLDDTVDTFAVEDTLEGTSIYLVSHRNRRVLARKVFAVDREDYESGDVALSRIIDSFYLFHLPREIRVSRDFEGRKSLEERLSERLGHRAKIIVVNPKTKGINAFRGLMLSHDEHELDKAKPLASSDVISRRLKKIFQLAKSSLRIEAFDVAHISGTGFIGASAVWENGRFVSEDYRILVPDISTKKNELTTLSAAVVNRLSTPSMPTPDLILLDGGSSQLNAVRTALENASLIDVPIIGAVKPPGRHSAVSHFLREDGIRTQFDPNDPAHNMLQLLRDEAHNLANRIHRDYREMKPFYEAAGHAEPLIVPIRLHAQNGGAEDLVPIGSR